jgi:hypothetical protein
MEKSFLTIAYVLIFFIFLILIVDVGKLEELKDITKDSLDFSTKAAALQVDTDPAKISQGIFQIDDTKGKNAFLQVMSLNLGTDTDTIKACMIDYEAINIPGTYTDPSNGNIFTITNPTFVAPMKFQFNGLYLKESIIISNNFAGSQLIGKH